MIDSRRRPPASSNLTQQISDDVSNRKGASLRSNSSGSITPMEDEDDKPRRTTRGRNPLPPSKGPLFPPLPPKQPKNSPKNSPQLNKPRSRQTSQSSWLPSSQVMLALTDPIPPQTAVTSLAVDHIPSGSGTSLTPPPTSEEAALEIEVEGDDTKQGVEGAGQDSEKEEGDDWDAYRQRRAVRGFSGVKGEVKKEPNDSPEPDEAEETPKTRRNSIKGSRALSFPNRSAANSPSVGSATPDVGGSASRSRKRRGEGQRLLDDHLLPEEMRKTGSLTGKRGRSDAPEEGHGDEGMLEEDAVVDEDPQDAKDAEADEDQVIKENTEAHDHTADDEDPKDVTRCVCQSEDGPDMMIQCDGCAVWQHGPCVGIWEDEEAPDEYFCEQCRPELHGPLRKWIRSKGRNIAAFIAPLQEDLQRLHSPHDPHPPSQSKRWSDPSLMHPPLTKSNSRSHHRKEPINAEETPHDGRRSTRGRVPPQPTGRGEKSHSAVKVEAKEPGKTKVTDHRRRVSIGIITSVSPPRESASPTAITSTAKRRSTMNSRDAAYEEEVKAALEASRREMMTSQERELEGLQEQEQVVEEPEELEEEVKEAKKGKRKRDEPTESVEPTLILGANGKTKHPNQYTYRPKPLSSSQPPTATSPAPRTASTPVPVPPPVTMPAPAQHDHGTRRAEKIANGIKEQPYTTINVNNLSWHLPDHLAQHAGILPTSAPVAIQVRSPRTVPSLPKNHYHNQRYGPFKDDRDEHGNLILPPEPPGRDTTGEITTHMEPPARPRYPVKRITTSEMRKRVRNLLDYVRRVQVEEGKRKERARILGIEVKPLPKPAIELEPEPEVDENGDSTMDPLPAPAPNSEDGTDPVLPGRTSAELMDDLSRDLVTFQEDFAAGMFATPLQLSTATFGVGSGGRGLSPVTPTFTGKGRMGTPLVPEPAYGYGYGYGEGKGEKVGGSGVVVDGVDSGHTATIVGADPLVFDQSTLTADDARPPPPLDGVPIDGLDD